MSTKPGQAQVSRTKAGATKRWLYRDGLRPVAELDGSGAVVARFVYASRENIPDYVVRVTSSNSPPQTFRLVSDHLGSPRMAIDVTTGAIVYQADY